MIISSYIQIVTRKLILKRNQSPKGKRLVFDRYNKQTTVLNFERVVKINLPQ